MVEVDLVFAQVVLVEQLDVQQLWWCGIKPIEDLLVASMVGWWTGLRWHFGWIYDIEHFLDVIVQQTFQASTEFLLFSSTWLDSSSLECVPQWLHWEQRSWLEEHLLDCWSIQWPLVGQRWLLETALHKWTPRLVPWQQY